MCKQLRAHTLHQECLAGGTLGKPGLKIPTFAGEHECGQSRDGLQSVRNLLHICVIGLLVGLELLPTFGSPGSQMLGLPQERWVDRLCDGPGRVLAEDRARLMAWEVRAPACRFDCNGSAAMAQCGDVHHRKYDVA